MNIDFSVLVKKYLIAFSIAILGLVATFYGLGNDQDQLFVIAAINLFLGGLLAVLFSAGILKRNLILAIGFVCVLVTIFFGYSSVVAVADAQKHIDDRARSEQLVRYNLSVIRDVQRAYRNETGKFAATWAELEDFYNNGKITVIDAEKEVPSRPLVKDEIKAIYSDNRAADVNMTEREAALLAAMGNPAKKEDLDGFKRDTIKKLFREDYMGSLSRIKERQRLGLGQFKAERLKYIPMSEPQTEWTLETRINVPYGGDTIPTIKVSGEEPVPFLMGGKKEMVGFGNLSTNSDKATWE
jgi:uncharacterized membrane protein YciS (DUF1049 family)